MKILHMRTLINLRHTSDIWGFQVLLQLVLQLFGLFEMYTIIHH